MIMQSLAEYPRLAEVTSLASLTWQVSAKLIEQIVYWGKLEETGHRDIGLVNLTSSRHISDQGFDNSVEF